MENGYHHHPPYKYSQTKLLDLVHTDFFCDYNLETLASLKNGHILILPHLPFTLFVHYPHSL